MKDKTKAYEDSKAWLVEKDNVDSVILELCDEGNLWKNHFTTIIRGSQCLPKIVERAEQMADVFSTPNEVHDLFDYYKYMVELIKEIIRKC